MSALLAWPDLEDALCTWLAEQLGFAIDQTDTVRPDNLTDLMTRTPPGFVQTHQLPGGTDNGDTSVLPVALDAYGPTRDIAWQLAQRVRAILTTGTPVVAGVPLDRVVCATAPYQLSDVNPAVRRFTATYRASVRRVAST